MVKYESILAVLRVAWHEAPQRHYTAWVHGLRCPNGTIKKGLAHEHSNTNLLGMYGQIVNCESTVNTLFGSISDRTYQCRRHRAYPQHSTIRSPSLHEQKPGFPLSCLPAIYHLKTQKVLQQEMVNALVIYNRESVKEVGSASIVK